MARKKATKGKKRVEQPAWKGAKLSTGGTLGKLAAEETALLVFLRHSG